MYDKGKGVPQDYAAAAKWTRKAAEQGDAKAQINLGVMYAEGQGVKQDDAAAAKWTRKAAEQGYATAQYNLVLLYEQGQGVQLDDVLAYMWIDLAAYHLTADGAGLHDQMIKARDRVAANMSSAQIAEAQRLAREWKPKK